MNNPWLVAIIGGAIDAVLGSIILFYLFDRKKEKLPKTYSQLSSVMQINF